ncbi:MAG: 4-hydroxy-3-methylbut-2-en-1-yl diphosphate synthase [Alphaproteobacteria bacterium ADurb.Bin438]|nr:MAG: 4-hydroxy-3-methylbut-2-en-1-yl diphosphate synthase [Alphaproteobacteria bacterium ADurb.Bin438]
MDKVFINNIVRRKTKRVYVGHVAVGDGAQISVQSMTNTKTADVKATIEQIRKAEEAGVDIMRISCPDEASTLALPEIIKNVKVPIIADIHFHYKRGIEAAKAGATCLRINPGNIGSIEGVKEVVRAAKDNNCSIRIGVNGGSLEKGLLEKYGEPCSDAMVESALMQAKMLEDEDFTNFKISVKSSNTLMTMDAYRKLSKACDYPLHLGITETGSFHSGLIKSAFGIGSLLAEGIGDTLRVSLTADIIHEVKAGFEILKTLDIRHRGIRLISCPTCARTSYNVIDIVATLEERLSKITAPLTIAIMGCVVNGPGEALHADIGVAGGGANNHMLYVKGKQVGFVKSEDVIEKVVELAYEQASAIDKK